ncbi:MAG: hypothetical protein RIQ81_2518 [Pseudomonadota bacterium]|jgi:SAM-dependent methyltransferase
MIPPLPDPRKKAALRSFYQDCYQRYARCLARCPSDGLAVEIGSGDSFARDFVPELLTSDLFPRLPTERLIDARNIDLPDQSVRTFFLLNTFHHIQDVARFFDEARRCLVPGGRVLIIDQYPGWISGPVLRYMHHEPFDTEAPRWELPKSPETHAEAHITANGALAWIVFERDLDTFRARWPELELARVDPHSPLFYWAAGGRKWWSLAHSTIIPAWRLADRILERLNKKFCSFVDIELVKADK